MGKLSRKSSESLRSRKKRDNLVQKQQQRMEEKLRLEKEQQQRLLEIQRRREAEAQVQLQALIERLLQDAYNRRMRLERARRLDEKMKASRQMIFLAEANFMAFQLVKHGASTEFATQTKTVGKSQSAELRQAKQANVLSLHLGGSKAVMQRESQLNSYKVYSGVKTLRKPLIMTGYLGKPVKMLAGVGARQRFESLYGRRMRCLLARSPCERWGLS